MATTELPDMPHHVDYPDNNPKTSQGALKAPLELVPPIVLVAMSDAFAEGARKYGPYNWREKEISSTVYYGAVLRHLTAWFDGQDEDEDTGNCHISHALACLAMLVDAREIGKLNDNRPMKGGTSEALRMRVKSKEDALLQPLTTALDRLHEEVRLEEYSLPESSSSPRSS
jgi:hypothetical protein